ncbi:hypothetical protein Tco_0214669 [Tanacetum coccineum]
MHQIFSMTFLDKACFLPEYVKDQKLLINHYVDMLKKEIREFISAKDCKNMNELMNAALEREQETKKMERLPLKRETEQGGPFKKRLKPSESYPISGGKGYLQCLNVGDSIRVNVIWVVGCVIAVAVMVILMWSL